MRGSCIGCDDTEWFQAYDGKEMSPQPDGSYKVTMFVDGKSASRIVKSIELANSRDRELCAELGIPFDPDA